jgi:replicative DNA helicase
MDNKKTQWPLISSLSNQYERLAEIHANPLASYSQNISTGYANLDGIIEWFKKKEITVIAARSNMGKTSFMMQLIYNIALTGKKAGCISLESSNEILMDRLIAIAMWVDLWKMHAWKLTEYEFMRIGDALESLSPLPIFIAPIKAASDMSYLEWTIKWLYEEHQPDIFFVDYIQLLKSGTITNRSQELSDIIARFKALSQEYNIPIVIISQINRSVETRPGNIPSLFDLRDSGSIEEDADVVMMLYREDYYNEFAEYPWKVDIFVKKNRNGRLGNAELKYEKEGQKYFELERTFHGDHTDDIN